MRSRLAAAVVVAALLIAHQDKVEAHRVRWVWGVMAIVVDMLAL